MADYYVVVFELGPYDTQDEAIEARDRVDIVALAREMGADSAGARVEAVDD